jgi:hypothetical protein
MILAEHHEKMLIEESSIERFSKGGTLLSPERETVRRAGSKGSTRATKPVTVAVPLSF